MRYERKRKEAKERKKFEPVREKNEREEREEREKREREEYERNVCELRERRMLELRKEFEYINKIYGVKDTNRKLARMNSDEWEIYKARKYVANENRKGHECYNAVEGKKLWINREAWRMIHER